MKKREIKTGAQSYGPVRSARRSQDPERLLSTVGYGPIYNRRLGSKTYLVDEISDITSKSDRPKSQSWKKVNDNVGTKMRSASTDSPPSIPKRDYEDSPASTPPRNKRPSDDGQHQNCSDEVKLYDGSQFEQDYRNCYDGFPPPPDQMYGYGFATPRPPPPGCMPMMMPPPPGLPPYFSGPMAPPPPPTPFFPPPMFYSDEWHPEPMMAPQPYHMPMMPPLPHQMPMMPPHPFMPMDLEMFTLDEKRRRKKKKKRISRSKSLEYAPPPFFPPPQPPPPFMCPPPFMMPPPPPFHSLLPLGPPSDMAPNGHMMMSDYHPAQQQQLALMPPPSVMGHGPLIPYIPTPTKSRSLIDLPAKQNHAENSTNQTKNGTLKKSNKDNNNKISEKEKKNSTCYLMCCKGFTQILWLIIGIILVGLILGLVLGLTLV